MGFLMDEKYCISMLNVRCTYQTCLKREGLKCCKDCRYFDSCQIKCTDAVKLMPCPFCGGIPEIEMETDSVACTKCGCMMFGKDIDTAIAAWNKRA